MEIRDTRNGEWHWVYNALLADPHLTPGEKLVYSAISTFGGHQTIHPTKEQLAGRCGVDAKTVQRALKKLEEVGYLKVEKSIGRGNANVYFLLKKPKGCNLCPFIKGDIQDHKRGHLEPEKGTKTTPYIDKYKDKEKAETKVSFSPLEGNSLTTDEDYAIVSDTPHKVKNPPRNKQALALREKLYDLFEREYKARPTTTASDYFRVLAAQKRIKDKDIIEIVEDELDKGKKRTVTEMLSARSVDIYLQDNA